MVDTNEAKNVTNTTKAAVMTGAAIGLGSFVIGVSLGWAVLLGSAGALLTQKIITDINKGA